MNSLNINATTTTPKIICNADEGIIYMEGDSYPENSFEFFKDLLTWVDDYLSSFRSSIKVELKLVYLNTSSVKVLMDIFDMLEEAHFKGREVSVHWFYDSRNERVVGLAEEFKEDLTFPFFIVATN